MKRTSSKGRYSLANFVAFMSFSSVQQNQNLKIAKCREDLRKKYTHYFIYQRKENKSIGDKYFIDDKKARRK